MFAKLLIAGRFACALLLLWAGASIMGWTFVLPIFALGLPVCWLAHTKPERWGWLIGRRPPPKPKPVDPAALDGGPVF